MASPLRPWQEKAINKALNWLVTEKKDRHFLINAAPGSGKTIASCELAKRLFDLGEITRVIVVAPRREVVKQWSQDFKMVTGRYMSKVTGADEDIEYPPAAHIGLSPKCIDGSRLSAGYWPSS